MPEIVNRDSLEQWLSVRAPEDAIAIAARAALRAIPGLATLFASERVDDPSAIILPVFRANAVATVAAIGTMQRMQVQQAATSAEFAAYFDTFSARSAADAATVSARSAAGSATNSANAAIYSARSAANSTNSTALTAISDAATVFSNAWKVIEADAVQLAKGLNYPTLLATPIWADDPQKGLAENWRILRDALLADDPLWRVWTDWYQARLDGRPMNVALELEKALIPNTDWAQGPTHVNAIIADLIAKHATSGTPQAEILSLDPATGKVMVERTEIRPRSNLENICDKIRDRIDDLKPRVEAENQLTALRPVIEKLERTVSKYADRPRRLHDDFARAFVNAQSLLTSGELAPDLEVDNLQADLQDSIDDLRAEYPEVDRMARARAVARIERLSPDDRESLEKAADAARDISEPDFAEEIEEDKKAIVDAPDEAAPKDGLPDGEEKDAGYRLGGRLLRIWRLVSSKEKINEVITNAKGKAELTIALTGAGVIIWQALSAVFRLVGF